MLKRRSRAGEYPARRAILRKAAELLAQRARSKAFRPSYTRNNPAARLKYNVFYFGEPGQPPRAIIKDSRLYIHAPDIGLPIEVAVVSQNERRMKHLGALHARLNLHKDSDFNIVRKVIERLAPSAGPSTASPTATSPFHLSPTHPTIDP